MYSLCIIHGTRRWHWPRRPNILNHSNERRAAAFEFHSQDKMSLLLFSVVLCKQRTYDKLTSLRTKPNIYPEEYTISDSILNWSRPVWKYSKAGITCSNSTRGTDYVPAFPCLFSPVSVWTLSWIDTPEKKHCNASNGCMISDIILKLNRPECLLRETQSNNSTTNNKTIGDFVLKKWTCTKLNAINCTKLQHRVYVYLDQLCQHCHMVTATGGNTCSCVDKKNQLDVTFCILYFSSNSCSTCFGKPCALHQELTTAWCYSLVLVCAVAAGKLSSPVGR